MASGPDGGRSGAGAAGGSSGSTTTKRAPSKGSLSAQIAPPCASTMPREIARPSPVPRTRRVRSLRACSNFSKIRSRSAAGIPSPAFQTVSPVRPGSAGARKTRTFTSPFSGVNLSAFVRRFESTCPIRPGSARIRTGSSGASTHSSWPRSAAVGWYRSTVARASSSRNTTSSSIRSFPFASRATSRSSSTIELSFSEDSRAIRR